MTLYNMAYHTVLRALFQTSSRQRQRWLHFTDMKPVIIYGMNYILDHLSDSNFTAMSKSKNDLLNGLFCLHYKELLIFSGGRANDLVAEDLVQETYLRLLQHPDLTSINNPRAYLYKVAANVSFDHHRKETVRGRYTETDEREPDSLVSPLPGPEALMEGEILLRHCLEALKTLPEVYSHVFLLNRIDGLTHSEIADALQLPHRTVERYCAKALALCFSHAANSQAN